MGLDELKAVVQDAANRVQEAKTSADALKASVTAEIARLEAIIAAGAGGINPADLDPVVAQLKDAVATLGTATAENQETQAQLDAERPAQQ